MPTLPAIPVQGEAESALTLSIRCWDVEESGVAHTGFTLSDQWLSLGSGFYFKWGAFFTLLMELSFPFMDWDPLTEKTQDSSMRSKMWRNT